MPHALHGASALVPRQRGRRERMSLDETFSGNAPTVGPQTHSAVERVGRQEQAYLEWSRIFRCARELHRRADPEGELVVMIATAVWKSNPRIKAEKLTSVHRRGDGGVGLRRTPSTRRPRRCFDPGRRELRVGGRGAAR